MKQNNFLACLIALTISTVLSAQTLAFHKGSFQINLSEGWSFANYSTSSLGDNKKVSVGDFTGDRDPISLEYGLSNHWGIGISIGDDFYYINPTSFYSFQAPVNQVKAGTSEFTIDGSYHFFVTSVSDVSLVASLGTAAVAIKGGNGDNTYQYCANGGIVRLGLHGRFFLWKHLGLLAMVSTYSESFSPQGVKGNNVGNNYSTSIGGVSVEGGLCYRFKR